MNARMTPAVSPDTEFFWNGVREHRLLVQQCDDCGVRRHPPRPMCPQCRSLAWTPVELPPRGTVFSFVMPKHPPLGFGDDHIVALVELEGGLRLVADLTGIAPEAATIGMPVEVTFVHYDDDVVLPGFRPAGAP